MGTTKKLTSEEIIKMLYDLNNQPISYVKREEYPDYQIIAILAAQTLPNQSVNELLTNADLIERWLNQPDYRIRIQEDLLTVFL